MAHTEFLRSLSRDERRSLTEKSNSDALLRVLILVALMTTVSAGIVSRVPYWFMLLPLSGLLLVSLFHFLHECIHDTPFKAQPLNQISASLCGFLLFIPSEWFRYFHRDHHRYTQMIGKDPELASAKPTTKLQWLIHLSGLTVYQSLAAVFRRYTVNKEIESFIPNKSRSKVVNEVRVVTIGYAIVFFVSVITGSAVLFWIWILPLLLGQPFLRLYLLAEHTLCEHSEDMLRNTRTVLSNPVVRWFTWNMPFHTEHHVYPAVPFHKLPALHQQLQDYLINTESSYFDFNHKLYKQLAPRAQPE